MMARTGCAATPAGPWTLRAWLVPVSGAAGVGLLAYLIVDLGPARIAAEFYRLGSILPAVLVVTGLKYPLQTAGWRLALPAASRPPWGESVSATIAGDALGYLTWAGPFTGEPIRALLVRGSVPVAAGVAAGAVERAIYNLTAGLLVGVVLLFLWVQILPATQTLAFVAMLVGALAITTAPPAARAISFWGEQGKEPVANSAAPAGSEPVAAAPPAPSASTEGSTEGSTVSLPTSAAVA